MKEFISEVKVLDKGYVKLLQADFEDKILQIASICYGKSQRDLQNKKEFIIKKLMFEHAGNPTSSFEFVNFLFEVKCPIFVARQWMRHRIGSFQEISRRYVSAEKEVYIPDEIKNLKNKNDDGNITANYVESLIDKIFELYNTLVDLGIKKEQARTILPLGLYTTFFWQVNLRSLINFLKVRLDKHAQKEIREYANAIIKLIRPYCKTVVNLIESEFKK